MKKRLLVIALIAIMLLLVGCKRIDLSQTPEHQGIIKLPEVPVKEETKPVEEPITPESTPIKPEPIEEVKTEFKVAKGDIFTFGKYTVKVKEILSSSHVLLDVNGEEIFFTQTRTSDIIGEMLLKYESSTFNTDRMITLKAEDFALKPNEFIMKYKEKVTVHGETVKLETITCDEGFKTNAIWVSILSDPSSSEKILEGKEITLGSVKIKALKIKDGQSTRQYAHVSINPI